MLLLDNGSVRSREPHPCMFLVSFSVYAEPISSQRNPSFCFRSMMYLELFTPNIVSVSFSLITPTDPRIKKQKSKQRGLPFQRVKRRLNHPSLHQNRETPNEASLEKKKMKIKTLALDKLNFLIGRFSCQKKLVLACTWTRKNPLLLIPIFYRILQSIAPLLEEWEERCVCEPLQKSAREIIEYNDWRRQFQRMLGSERNRRARGEMYSLCSINANPRGTRNVECPKGQGPKASLGKCRTRTEKD